MFRIKVFLQVMRCTAWIIIPALAAPASSQAGGVYFVKENDTLYSISRLFGTNVDLLRQTNKLTGTTIKPGDRLRIPDKPALPRSTAVSAIPGSSENTDRVRQTVCREETVYHTVARGETLSSISRRYETTVKNLLRLNALRTRSRLAIGQRVVVRRSSPRTHVVRTGDDLAKIAANQQVTVDDLRRLNNFEGERLKVGQRLLLEPCDRLAAAGGTPPPLGGSNPVGTTNVNRIIEIAKNMIGIPYRFGGTTLRGIDCSGYVQRVFGLIDIAVPRTAREQFVIGARIARDQLAAGDLVFFQTYASFPSHVGIYLGEELFIHASSISHRVTIDNLEEPFYRKRFIGGRRVIDEPVSNLAVTP